MDTLPNTTAAAPQQKEETVRGKRDEKGKIPDFDTIDLEDIDTYLGEHGKTHYVFIADMHGQASTFFQYRSEYLSFEFGNEVKKCIISKS